MSIAGFSGFDDIISTNLRPDLQPVINNYFVANMHDLPYWMKAQIGIVLFLAHLRISRGLQWKNILPILQMMDENKQ